jgi:cytoskeletal protein RodZ
MKQQIGKSKKPIRKKVITLPEKEVIKTYISVFFIRFFLKIISLLGKHHRSVEAIETEVQRINSLPKINQPPKSLPSRKINKNKKEDQSESTVSASNQKPISNNIPQTSSKPDKQQTKVKEVTKKISLTEVEETPKKKKEKVKPQICMFNLFLLNIIIIFI